MSKICGIYSITNLKNCKKYIGQSTNIKNRWYTHKYNLRKGQHTNKHLQKSFDKYGEDNFKLEILAECYITELDKLEIDLIKQYNTTNQEKGYNHEHGGLKNKRITLESKIKRRGKWHHSISTKTKEDYAFRNHCNELWDTSQLHMPKRWGGYDEGICLPDSDINSYQDWEGETSDDYIVTQKEKHIDKFNIDIPDHLW
jgi:group I intron endonuclease